MLVSLKELMADAEEKGYAVGAFNAVNLEALTAIIAAAEETGKGVILNHAEVHFPLMPIEVIGPIMVDMAKKAKVPVCVHLDHGQSLETCMKAIRLGFSSVMLDVSGDDYEENVAQTALMCRLAHSVGVTVEAELGHIFQSDIGVGEAGDQETLDSFESAEDVYTDPDLAKDFVERTGVDALAIAFGTAHGVYKIKPKLDLDRIKLIKEKINVPFVMHGGSGLTKEEFQTSIRNGIRKINYYTYMSLAGGKAVKEFVESKKDGENVFYHDIPLIAIEAMKENVKEAINIFSLEV
ncbi:MAG: class II fructose-bisphosphate aldolase [Clostridia bacterium]|nr:class II fructose-bisphosphate aldolase [Clostridia bacterium]